MKNQHGILMWTCIFNPTHGFDETTCIEWAEKTLKKFVKDEELDKFLLLCDNLEA